MLSWRNRRECRRTSSDGDGMGAAPEVEQAVEDAEPQADARFCGPAGRGQGGLRWGKGVGGGGGGRSPGVTLLFFENYNTDLPPPPPLLLPFS